MAYSFFLDGVLLPVTPGSLQIKVKNQNKTVSLLNEGEVNFLKLPGLSEVQFDALLPQVSYPFANGGREPADFYLSKLERLKTGKKPFQFIVSRAAQGGKLLFDTNMKVSLEDYEISPEAVSGFRDKNGHAGTAQSGGGNAGGGRNTGAGGGERAEAKDVYGTEG